MTRLNVSCSAQSLGGAHPFQTPSPFLVIIGRVWSAVRNKDRAPPKEWLASLSRPVRYAVPRSKYMQHQSQQGQNHLSDFEKDKHRITTGSNREDLRGSRFVTKT
jgi:hypothetical protein